LRFSEVQKELSGMKVELGKIEENDVNNKKPDLS